MRYLILIVIMLIPAWGWAGENVLVYEGNCSIWTDKEAGLMMEGPDCPKPQPACYQRMREAMRVMEAFLRKGDVIPTHEYARMKEQWDQVVKDCVEGR